MSRSSPAFSPRKPRLPVAPARLHGLCVISGSLACVPVRCAAASDGVYRQCSVHQDCSSCILETTNTCGWCAEEPKCSELNRDGTIQCRAGQNIFSGSCPDSTPRAGFFEQRVSSRGSATHGFVSFIFFLAVIIGFRMWRSLRKNQRRNADGTKLQQEEAWKIMRRFRTMHEEIKHSKKNSRNNPNLSSTFTAPAGAASPPPQQQQQQQLTTQRSQTSVYASAVRQSPTRQASVRMASTAPATGPATAPAPTPAPASAPVAATEAAGVGSVRSTPRPPAGPPTAEDDDFARDGRAGGVPLAVVQSSPYVDYDRSSASDDRKPQPAANGRAAAAAAQPVSYSDDSSLGPPAD